jgi:hypothetical protein
VPTTPLRAYPYPSLSAAPDVPADLSALALAADADMGPIYTAWTAYTPTWTNTSGTPAIGTGGSVSGVRALIGKTVHGRIRWVAGSTGYGSGGTGQWSFGLPVTAAHSAGIVIGAWTYVKVATGVRYLGHVVSASTSSMQCIVGTGPITVMSHDDPTTHGAGDTLEIAFTYERA